LEVDSSSSTSAANSANSGNSAFASHRSAAVDVEPEKQEENENEYEQQRSADPEMDVVDLGVGRAVVGGPRETIEGREEQDEIKNNEHSTEI
jgi:hypothetical protein